MNAHTSIAKRDPKPKGGDVAAAVSSVLRDHPVSAEKVRRRLAPKDIQSQSADALPPAAATPYIPPANGVVPSSPLPIPLRRLRRATENVRHTRIDEDVQALADDIAAHGLLQSLIGYATAGTADDQHPETLAWQLGDGLVHIVGGGRRFQALRWLEEDGQIGPDFPVPVLIRDREDAIELSLAENLQQRTMSPVDEFIAFRALMERGTESPATLAKRFGFSERIVRQRLRLADLDIEVLDALAAKEISLDAAMAFATSQDHDLQRDVFRAEKKKSASYSNSFRPNDVRWALKRKGFTTKHQLFAFVGAEAYERRGGGYEDDLFTDELGRDGERTLSHPQVLTAAARELIDFQMAGKLEEWKQRDDLAPTIVGYVITNSMLLDNYGNGAPVPKGYERVERHAHAPMWKTVRNNGIDVQILVGITYEGELKTWPQAFFVPKEQKNAVAPPTEQPGAYRQQTPEERAAAEREATIAKHARRLAVGSFAGTPFEGRAFWPSGYGADGRSTVHAGVLGRMVPVEIFVSDAEIAAQTEAAEEKAKEEERARLVSQLRAERLTAMEPPAIVIVDGLPWQRGDDGTYAPIDELEDGYFNSWTHMVHNLEPDELSETYATREAFEQAMAGAIAADEVSA